MVGCDGAKGASDVVLDCSAFRQCKVQNPEVPGLSLPNAPVEIEDRSCAFPETRDRTGESSEVGESARCGRSICGT